MCSISTIVIISSHPLLLANSYTGTWRRGGGGIRRSHFVAMAHLKAELWLVRWHQNKHGGRNESNKAFENKCYSLYEINKFRINNSRVRKVIHGWLSAWPAGSHRLVSWFPGDAFRLETRRLAGGISWSHRQSTMDSLKMGWTGIRSIIDDNLGFLLIIAVGETPIYVKIISVRRQSEATI